MASCKAMYGSYCCVPRCTNNGRTREKPGTHFFRIPRDHRFGYVQPVTEGQDGECVVQENEKGFLMTASCVAEGNLPGYIAPVSELDAADSQMDISGSSSTGAELCAVHDDASEVSPSASSFLASEVSPSASRFLDSASSSVGGFPVACNSAAKGSLSKKLRRTIRRLQSKVASCQWTISRLRKHQRQLPPSISKALGIIHPHVTEEVYKLLCATCSCSRGAKSSASLFGLRNLLYI
nr:uncharacterized protein LOC129381585 isoform X2 [Dermacentor andersoni]